MIDLTNRYEFLGVAILFEGSLIGIAGLAGRWVEVDPLGQFDWSLSAMAFGALAALPMFALFLASARVRVAAVRRIHVFLIESLGPSLAACRGYDLLLLGAVAGIGEELLFRGVLQPWCGLVYSNLLFGLLHAVTPLYAVLAGLMGAYLGWVSQATGNVFAAIVAHGLYDAMAFAVVARAYRRHASRLGPSPETTGQDTP